MVYLSTGNQSEIRLRPVPDAPAGVLSALVACRCITAALRLAPKSGGDTAALKPGDEVVLRVYDDMEGEQARERIVIRSVTVRPLAALTPEDLADTMLYGDWQSAQRALSSVSGDTVSSDANVELAAFDYAENVSLT